MASAPRTEQGDHEPVAHRLDLPAAVVGHAAPDHLLVRAKDPVGGGVAQGRAQVGRAFGRR
jgi:hypothetical protein